MTNPNEIDESNAIDTRHSKKEGKREIMISEQSVSYRKDHSSDLQLLPQKPNGVAPHRGQAHGGGLKETEEKHQCSAGVESRVLLAEFGLQREPRRQTKTTGEKRKRRHQPST